jgi:hypothetical protein
LFRLFVVECLVVNGRRVIIAAEAHENLFGYNRCRVLETLSLDKPGIE